VTGTWNNTGQNVKSVHHLEETGGSYLDSTNNSNDSTNIIVTSRTSDGQFGISPEFDAVDDAISFGQTLGDTLFAGGNDYTVVLWSYYRNLSSNTQQRAMDYSNTITTIGHEVRGNNGLEFNIFDGDHTQVTSGTSPTNEWIHNIATFDNSQNQMAYFVDAVLQGTATSNEASQTDDVLSLGGNASSTTIEGIDGFVDEWRIYSEVKPDEWKQADFDASPKAGQVYFSQQAAETAGTNFDGTTNTATGSGLGNTINLSGKTTAKPNTATGSGTGNTIFLEAEFVTLAATASVTGGSANLAGTTTITVITAEASGSGGTSTLTQIIQAVSASAQSSGQIINLDRLTGTVDVEGQATSGVDVNVVDKTNNILHETTTDSNGNWAVDSGDGILYQVAYLFDDGTTFFGDAEESDTT